MNLFINKIKLITISASHSPCEQLIVYKVFDITGRFYTADGCTW